MSTDLTRFPHLMTVDHREELLLAAYATFSRDSLGREHPEPAHPYRGCYQRDRDRILHSSAYRRLSGKMQVFTGGMGDYHRTRLTHTQEVASIARTIGRSLRLNEDLIEALALMHDLGHPPYGHAGEDALNEVAAGAGGFSHNQFALTIVRELEWRFLPTPGLNLSHEVLQGQLARIDKTCRQRPPLEVQLVDASDSTTYDAHDTDDAIKLRLVSIDEMSRIPLIRECLDYVGQQYAGLNPKQRRKALVHRLIDRQVSDIVEFCSAQLQQFDFRSAEQARTGEFLLGPSPALAEQKAELETFLRENVYRHPELVKVRKEAQQRLQQMYYGIIEDPTRMPPRYQERSEVVGIERAAVEFIAGMTDHYCEDLFERLFTH